jgi:hypothetical protein
VPIAATDTFFLNATCLAQLKVNLRPLYAAVHAALATLTPTAQASLIWQLLFAELALAASGEMAEVESAAGPAWEVEMREWTGEVEEEVLVEDVRSFRDPPRTRREELLNVELRRDTGALFEAIKEVRFLPCTLRHPMEHALTSHLTVWSPAVPEARRPRPARRA